MCYTGEFLTISDDYEREQMRKKKEKEEKQKEKEKEKTMMTRQSFTLKTFPESFLPFLNAFAH